MDNFKIDIVCEGQDLLRVAMQIAFKNAAGGKAKYCIKNADKGLILLWSKEGDALELPVSLGWESAANLAWDWLQSVDYGEQPDHDGDNGKGWRIYTEQWGHVGQYCYAICAINPVWAMYGK